MAQIGAEGLGGAKGLGGAERLGGAEGPEAFDVFNVQTYMIVSLVQIETLHDNAKDATLPSSPKVSPFLFTKPRAPPASTAYDMHEIPFLALTLGSSILPTSC